MRKILVTLAAALVLLVLFAFPPWGTAHSQPPEEVLVTNLPDVVPIKGEVTVDGVVRQGAIIRRVDLIVPPVDRVMNSSFVRATWPTPTSLVVKSRSTSVGLLVSAWFSTPWSRLSVPLLFEEIPTSANEANPALVTDAP